MLTTTPPAGPLADFHNGASIIIDTFITSGETKWLRQSGLVMLLPHGYDGAGPEHSSARIERFLQMVNSQAWARGAPCVDPAGAASLVPGYSDKSMTEALNFIVANPTTPANYFHLLRRQIHRPWRKPLVVFSPKTLLRHADAVSALTDMAPGTGFQPWLADPAAPAAADVDRVLLCSGKIYYELAKRRAELKGEGAGGRTALVRVEELAPFPAGAIAAHVKATYPRAARVSWVQEEPANMGAWTWAEAHLTPALAAAGLPGVEYIGRPALAAPAVGMGKRNKAQQDFLLQAALPAKL
jgi:2-oxoglutarate dehydrogenase complex dehydrogenase (E1) component-like enzyme